MLFEDYSYRTALHANAATVHETDFGKPSCMRFGNVFVNHRWYIPTQERMQVKRVFDGHPMIHRSFGGWLPSTVSFEWPDVS